MGKKKINSGVQIDWFVPLGKESVMVEITPAPERNHLKIFGARIMHLLGIALPKRTAPGYRTYGKYRVKETFAGEESLTSLLTQYVERTVSMRC